MTDKLSLPSKGLALDMSGGTPTPQPVVITTTFGRQSTNDDFNAASTDTFPNVYLIKNSGAGIDTAGASYRAVSGDVLKIVTLGIGAETSGTVNIGVYTADTPAGPWTLAKQIDDEAAPTGANQLVELDANLTLTAGKYYYLAIQSNDCEIVQYPQDGGSERWTGGNPMPSPIADADGSTSNYVVELFGTVQRTINP